MTLIRPIILVVMLLAASCSSSAVTASGSLQPKPAPTALEVTARPAPSVSELPEAEAEPLSPANDEDESSETGETEPTGKQPSEASPPEPSQLTTDGPKQITPPPVTPPPVTPPPGTDEQLPGPETADEPPPATPTVEVPPTATPTAQEQPAPATSAAGGQQFVAGSEASEPAANGPSDGADQASPATSDRSVELWCALHAPQIQAAFANTVYAQVRDPSSLPLAVDDLHLVLRQAMDAAPREIQDAVQIVNDSIGVLEPVLQPVGWDWSRINRSLVTDATNAYNAAGIQIDEYNVATCGLELGNALPSDDLALFDPAAVPAGPTSSLPGSTDMGAPSIGFEMENLISEFEAAGLSRADATCLVDALSGILASSGEPTTSLNRLSTCGITAERLFELLEVVG